MHEPSSTRKNRVDTHVLVGFLLVIPPIVWITQRTRVEADNAELRSLLDANTTRATCGRQGHAKLPLVMLDG